MWRLQTKVGRLQTILGNVGGWYYLCSVIMDKWEDDCEVDAGIYEVRLHERLDSATFAPSTLVKAGPEKPNGKESKLSQMPSS